MHEILGPKFITPIMIFYIKRVPKIKKVHFYSHVLYNKQTIILPRVKRVFNSHKFWLNSHRVDNFA